MAYIFPATGEGKNPVPTKSKGGVKGPSEASGASTLNKRQRGKRRGISQVDERRNLVVTNAKGERKKLGCERGEDGGIIAMNKKKKKGK